MRKLTRAKIQYSVFPTRRLTFSSKVATPSTLLSPPPPPPPPTPYMTPAPAISGHIYPLPGPLPSPFSDTILLVPPDMHCQFEKLNRSSAGPQCARPPLGGVGIGAEWRNKSPRGRITPLHADIPPTYTENKRPPIDPISCRV